MPRTDWNWRTFGGLPLADVLAARDTEAQYGLHIVDVRSGEVVHWVRIEGMVSELYDVVALPNAVQPMALGFKTDEIQRLLTIGRPGSYWPTTSTSRSRAATAS